MTRRQIKGGKNSGITCAAKYIKVQYVPTPTINLNNGTLSSRKKKKHRQRPEAASLPATETV
jgi:hypothetical protein